MRRNGKTGSNEWMDRDESILDRILSNPILIRTDTGGHLILHLTPLHQPSFVSGHPGPE